MSQDSAKALQSGQQSETLSLTHTHKHHTYAYIPYTSRDHYWIAQTPVLLFPFTDECLPLAILFACQYSLISTCSLDLISPGFFSPTHYPLCSLYFSTCAINMLFSLLRLPYVYVTFSFLLCWFVVHNWVPESPPPGIFNNHHHICLISWLPHGNMFSQHCSAKECHPRSSFPDSQQKSVKHHSKSWNLRATHCLKSET